MFRDYLPHRFVWKTLFMISQRERGIYAGQDRGLAGSALRAAFDTESRIGPGENTAQCSRGFVFYKMRERFRIGQSKQRVLVAFAADAEAVDEK